MNYMEQVAEMLGVEIGEEFKIEGYPDDERYKLTRKNLKYFYDGMWCPISGTLTYLLSGQNKVVKIPKPILDKKEKEYLSYVIKPFRDRIKYIYKFTCANGDYEAIAVVMEGYGYCDWLNFPKFKKGSMYKGMELIKEYSLGELEL